MCCKVMAVDELGKPGGVVCAHVRAGKGCGIYETRPVACRSFACVWLMDEEMPHRFRPDQTRVVLDQDADGTRLIARCDPGNPQAWRRNPIHAALTAYAAQHWGTGRIVLAVAGRRTWLVTPSEEIDLGEVARDADLKIVETPDGRVEAQVLPAPG